jgi:hypothetical protein
MRDLTTWLTNPFDDPHISVKELLAFTADHFQRVSANPLPALTPRLAPTALALTAVSDTHSDDDAQLGVRMACVQSKKAFRAALPAGIGQVAVAVEAQFGEKSPQFTACFPQGRSVFGTCTDQELDGKLGSIVDWVTAQKPPLDPQVLANATALQTGWAAVIKPTGAASGGKTQTIAAKNAACVSLQTELFANLLVLAQTFPRQPEQLALYMQQSLLQPHTQTPVVPVPPTPVPTPVT